MPTASLLAIESSKIPVIQQSRLNKRASTRRSHDPTRSRLRLPTNWPHETKVHSPDPKEASVPPLANARNRQLPKATNVSINNSRITEKSTIISS